MSPQFKSSVLWTNSKHMQELVHHRRHGSMRMCVHGYVSSAEQQVKHMDQRGKWQRADVHFKGQAWGRRGGVMVECGTTKSSYLYGYTCERWARQRSSTETGTKWEQTIWREVITFTSRFREGEAKNLSLGHLELCGWKLGVNVCSTVLQSLWSAWI